MPREHDSSAYICACHRCAERRREEREHERWDRERRLGGPLPPHDPDTCSICIAVHNSLDAAQPVGPETLPSTAEAPSIADQLISQLINSDPPQAPTLPGVPPRERTMPVTVWDTAPNSGERYEEIRQRLIREGNAVPRSGSEGFDPFTTRDRTSQPGAPPVQAHPAPTAQWVSIPGYPGLEFRVPNRFTCGLCGDPAEHLHECSGRPAYIRPINCARCGNAVAEVGHLVSSRCHHSDEYVRSAQPATDGTAIATRLSNITVLCTFAVLHGNDVPNQEQLKLAVQNALRKVIENNSGKVGELRLVSLGNPRRLPHR